MRFSGGVLAKHWIKRDQLENVDRLEVKFFRGQEDGFVADESKVFLPQVQEWHRRASTMVVRVTRDRRVHSLLQFGGNLDARRVCHR
jgi:hypothetical protein